MAVARINLIDWWETSLVEARQNKVNILMTTYSIQCSVERQVALVRVHIFLFFIMIASRLYKLVISRRTAAKSDSQLG